MKILQNSLIPYNEYFRSDKLIKAIRRNESSRSGWIIAISNAINLK